MRAPRLTDGVIVLDAFALTDVAAHVAGEDDEQARRFGWYPKRSTEAGARMAIEAWQAQWASGGPRRTFAVRALPDEALAGGCELRLAADERGEISYWTFPAFRGRGLATRAVGLVAGWSFAELGLARAELHIEPDNHASLAVARRAGFTCEGVLRQHAVIGGRRADMVCWSRLPADPPPNDQEQRA